MLEFDYKIDTLRHLYGRVDKKTGKQGLSSALSRSGFKSE